MDCYKWWLGWERTMVRYAVCWVELVSAVKMFGLACVLAAAVVMRSHIFAACAT